MGYILGGCPVISVGWLGPTPKATNGRRIMDYPAGAG